VVNTSSRYFTL